MIKVHIFDACNAKVLEKKLNSAARNSIVNFYDGLVVSRRLDELIRIVENNLRLLRNKIVAFAYLEFGRINGQNAGSYQQKSPKIRNFRNL